MSLMSIFWRTFAQLALAVLLAVQGLEWVDSGAINVNFETLGLGLLGAFIGAVVAVLWAFGLTAAVSALDKALRSAAQAAAGGLGAIVLNEAADLFELPVVLLGIAVSVVFAFAITYLQYQGPTPPTPQPPDH